MLHIKQKSDTPYIVVKNEDESLPDGNLENHPSIVDHPDKFEIVDGEIPSNAQFLIYKNE